MPIRSGCILLPTVITSGPTWRGMLISRPGTMQQTWPTTSGATYSIRSGPKSVRLSRVTLGSAMPRRWCRGRTRTSLSIACSHAVRPNIPRRVLTTDGEFHSFRRQSERLAEDGLIALHAVPTQPFATLAERLAAAARALAPDFIYVSQVLFSSGFALADLTGLVATLAAPDRLVVIDGYHGFLARPTDLSGIADRAFYVAGGYKCAMAGEGACFMHCPQQSSAISAIVSKLPFRCC